MKQKIVFLLATMFSLLSCNDGAKPESNEEHEIQKKCACADLREREAKYYLAGDLYTGICEDLDQHNEVIRHKEFTNGIRVYEIGRKKIDGIYVTTDSIYYDGGPSIGFYIKTESRGGLVYVSESQEYLNGRGSKRGYIYISDSGFGSVSYLGDKSNDEISFKLSEYEFKEALEATITKANEVNPRIRIISRYE